jgi:ascorbate-specific PTS system EIIC-type component UlaA
MCTTSEQDLHFYAMFKTSNRENDEIKQVMKARKYHFTLYEILQALQIVVKLYIMK